MSVLGAESFADWMAKDYCDRPLAVGQVLYFTGLNERILEYFHVTEGILYVQCLLDHYE